MFSDVKESIELTNEFRGSKNKTGVEVNFRVLQQKTWPITQNQTEPEPASEKKPNKKKAQDDEEMQQVSIMQVTLPKPLSTIFQQFQQFYLSKPANKGRRLDYFAEHGSCVLKAHLGCTFTVKTTIAQALVLL